MKNAANLQKAMKSLATLKVSAAMARKLATRTVIDVSNRYDVVKLPIAAFLTWIEKVQPICIQRNDAYRLNHNLANHLAKFSLPQGQFAVVFLDGKFYLVDGNTRKRAWLTCTEMAVPSHVFVMVLIPEHMEEAMEFYGCYDSKQSKKTVRDEMLSLLHSAGISPETLLSKLVAGGKFVTVAQSMAKKYRLKNNLENRKAIVASHASELMQLDSLGLDEKTIPMAAVWVALRLYKQMPDFSEIITMYINELRLFETDNAMLISAAIRDIPERARQACEDQQTGTSGAKACRAMFPTYLMGFATYVRSHSKGKAFSKSYLKTLSAKLDVVLEAELGQDIPE